MHSNFLIYQIFTHLCLRTICYLCDLNSNTNLFNVSKLNIYWTYIIEKKSTHKLLRLFKYLSLPNYNDENMCFLIPLLNSFIFSKPDNRLFDTLNIMIILIIAGGVWLAESIIMQSIKTLTFNFMLNKRNHLISHKTICTPIC